MTWAYLTIGVLMVITAAAIALVVLLRDRLVDMRIELRNRDAELLAAEEARCGSDAIDQAVIDATQELVRNEISGSHGVAVDDEPLPGDDRIGAAPLSHIERWAWRSLKRRTGISASWPNTTS